MKDLDSEKKIAVLIDAENAQYSVLGAVLAELSKHGHIVVKKAKVHDIYVKEQRK